MNYKDTEVGKKTKWGVKSFKKGDNIYTYFNKDKEVLNSIKVNLSKKGVLKIDLKQFEHFDMPYADLFIGEIVDCLFEYIGDDVLSKEFDHLVITNIV